MKWVGDPPRDMQPIQLQSLRRLTTTDVVASYVCLTMVTSATKQPRTTPSLDLQAILDSFAPVFQKPSGLPPSRATDHSIHLNPQSGPINVKPYRYPHFQKQVMEQLMADMRNEGIIQPSTSLFSSPVLLVRKKDGSWRFCVDYRALNAITVRDRFPISTIDE